MVAVRVVVPTRLSKKARDLLHAYAEEAGEEIHEKHTLMDRIKEMFGGRKRPDSTTTEDGPAEG